MNKREYITAITPWKITAGEHTGKWLAGVQWTEGGEQKDRQIDCPRSTFHEALRDANALACKIEVEGMQGDCPPLVTSETFYSNEHQEVILEWLEANCGIHAQSLSDAVDLIERLMMGSRPLVTTQARERADVEEVHGDHGGAAIWVVSKRVDTSDKVFIEFIAAPIDLAKGAIETWAGCDSTEMLRGVLDGNIVAANGRTLVAVIAPSQRAAVATARLKFGDVDERQIAEFKGRSQRDAAEQQISDAIEVMHDNGIDVSEGLVASVTALAKAWRLLSETHNATVQEAVEAQAKAEKERDEVMEWKEIWRDKCRDLEANLAMARKNLSAACEQREEATKERDGLAEANRQLAGGNEALVHERNQARRQVAAVLEAASAAGIAGDDAVSSAAAMLNRISELSGMRAADTAVIESLGHECEDLRAKVSEQARTIAALHQALGDAFGLPDA